ncbi:MAG: MBL fold metallo-hydrolase [Gammaproteobacteria bacterium]
MQVMSFLHGSSSTYSYVVSGPATRHAVVIDPVLDYDAAAARTGTDSADELVAYVRAEKLKVDWVLETHAHADHLSAAQHVKLNLGARTGIGAGILQVQKAFKAIYNLGDEFLADGSQFDHLFTDGETFILGDTTVRVLVTPGHTSDSVTYIVGDAAFVGDTLFMPDSGTARCDFPGGDAGVLYDSIQRILALPPATRLCMCHDYAPGGRRHKNETTVAEQKRANIHVHDGISREEFIHLRRVRDKALSVPELLLPAIQINMRAGRLPEPEGNGVSYLKIPLNTMSSGQ